MSAHRCVLVVAMLGVPWISAVSCTNSPEPQTPATPPDYDVASASSECTSAEAPAETTPPVATTPAVASASVVAASASASASTSSSATAVSTVTRQLEGVVNNPAGKPVANVVVYLEDGPVVPGRGDKARIDQKDMQMIPFLTVVTEGGVVSFGNSDPFPHNVYAVSNEAFNLGMISQYGTKSRKFTKLGLTTLLCNLHPQMIAYVYVVSSSYFAVTNKQGKFKIKDVPEGTWKLAVMGKNVSADSQPVTVKDSDASVTLVTKK